jgi:hypothetical protein
MKFLQCALSGFLLSLTAAAQTAAPSAPAATPKTTTPQAASPSTTPKISTLGGDEAKGPEHPLTLDQMKALFVAMGYDKQVADMDANREKMIAQNKTRNPYMPTAVWDDLDASFKKVDYETALYDVYKKFLSTDDAAKLIEFSKTEAGKDYFANAAVLTRDSTMAINRAQQEVSQQVQARHKDEIEAAMKKFRDEQQQKQKAAAPSLGPVSPSAPPAPGAAAPAPAPAKPATPPAAPPASTTPQN